jgi:hypothetical protein
LAPSSSNEPVGAYEEPLLPLALASWCVAGAARCYGTIPIAGRHGTGEVGDGRVLAG